MVWEFCQAQRSHPCPQGFEKSPQGTALLPGCAQNLDGAGNNPWEKNPAGGEGKGMVGTGKGDGEDPSINLQT